jgi:hypothetical protein
VSPIFAAETELEFIHVLKTIWALLAAAVRLPTGVEETTCGLTGVAA